MTCNDCVYFGLCEALSVYYDMPIGGASECALYKNKADFVEVVRCKDCKHWLKDVAGCTDITGRCEWANYMVGTAGYCVYGERKDGDDK